MPLSTCQMREYVRRACNQVPNEHKHLSVTSLSRVQLLIDSFLSEGRFRTRFSIILSVSIAMPSSTNDCSFGHLIGRTSSASFAVNSCGRVSARSFGRCANKSCQASGRSLHPETLRMRSGDTQDMMGACSFSLSFLPSAPITGVGGGPV